MVTGAALESKDRFCACVYMPLALSLPLHMLCVTFMKAIRQSDQLGGTH